MKKYDNFCSCFKVLEETNRNECSTNEIYRMGILGQFNLSFELAIKALQATLRLHNVDETKTGSPREIVKLAFKIGFLEDIDTWLSMLGNRNTAVHEYNEENILKVIDLIYDDYIPALKQFQKTISEKIEAVENEI